MPSARARLTTAAGSGAALVLAAGGLAGCATTQQTAARLQLNSARARAIENPTRVTVANPNVTVQGLSRVGAGRAGAWVVTVHNASRHAVSDLPISVGYRRAKHQPVYLNSSTSLSYFANHLPGIAAGATVRWVFTGTIRLPAGARPFALVGTKPGAPVGAIAQLPELSAQAKPGVVAGRVTVRLTNHSGVPQLQMPLYAYARRGGRYVAAGDATVASVGTNSTQTVHIHVLGAAGRASLAVEALPTIFK